MQADGSIRVWVENSVGNNARSHNGMGLGLIIARTIAQAHGGRLSIERTAAGAVRSTLDLPLEEVPEYE
jgi:signal transduction histidine kinase